MAGGSEHETQIVADCDGHDVGWQWMVKILEKKTSTNINQHHFRISTCWQPLDPRKCQKPLQVRRNLLTSSKSSGCNNCPRSSTIRTEWWDDGMDGMGWPQKSPTCLQFFPTLAIESSCPTCNWQLFFGFWALLGRRLSCWRGWAKHRRLWLAQCARCDERGWWKHFAKHVLTQQHFFQVRLYIAFEVTTWETGRCEVAAW